MKTTIKIMLLAILSFLMISCEKEIQADKTNNIQTDATLEISSDELTQEFENSLKSVNISESTTESDPFLINYGLPCQLDFTKSDDIQGGHSNKCCKKFECNDLFASMDLNDRQKAGLRGAINSYENCVSSIREKLKTKRETLSNKYNEDYDKLVAAHRSGRITKEQFEMMVSRLQHSNRVNLKSLEDRELIYRHITRCYSQYLRNVRNNLNLRQWNQFAECQRKCFTTCNKDSVRK
jgi:hypothetical protein